MQDIGVTPKGRNARDLCSSKPVPLTLPLLDADQKALLLRWARSVMLKHVNVEHC